jgi:hypothetical protein
MVFLFATGYDVKGAYKAMSVIKKMSLHGILLIYAAIADRLAD